VARKKKKDDAGVKGDWIVTYSDMVTLLLCFFVALFDASEIEPGQMAVLLSALANIGMGAKAGGENLTVGKDAALGNKVNALPATVRGNLLDTALKKAVSAFSTEVKSKKITITTDERGLVITLAGDALFAPASAKINIEETREMLIRVAGFLDAGDMKGRKFRIEGHTDSVPVDPAGPWESNWQLSGMRAIAVLNYLTAFGVDESRFQVAGFADTVPVAKNDTPEQRQYNRRVDIIVLDDNRL
jgi:chemotaxis protein MotB